MKISKAQAKRELTVGRKLRLTHCLIGLTPEGKGYRTVKLVRSADMIMTNHDNDDRDSTLTMQCTSVDLTEKILTLFEHDRIAAKYQLDCERLEVENEDIPEFCECGRYPQDCQTSQGGLIHGDI